MDEEAKRPAVPQTNDVADDSEEIPAASEEAKKAALLDDDDEDVEMRPARRLNKKRRVNRESSVDEDEPMNSATVESPKRVL